MLFHSLEEKVDETVPIFPYLGSNRLYKMLLWKLLCTCAGCTLAIYVAKAAQELHWLFVRFKSSLSTMN
jgi:hypothetical protein